MANSELSVMLTAKGNLEGELKSARGRVKELDAQIKQLNASGQGVGDDLADEYRKATRAAASLSDELNTVNKKVKETASASTSAASKVGNAWKKAASVFNNDLVAGLSGAALIMFGKKAVDTFAQVQDASSALQATFGANGDALIKWAQSSGDALNLSQQEALNAAQTFAIFAESAGLSGTALQGFSTNLTARAADLASYFGGTTADAVQALSSGLAGQSEVLRRYGIFADDAALKAEALAQGIYNGVGPLTAQQKILATQAVILKGSARAQGDVARTADSMANQIKDSQQQMADFQATAGETIAVGLAPLLKILNSAAKAFSSMPAPMKQVAIAIGLIGTAALIVTPKILALKTQLAAAGIGGAAAAKGGIKAAAGIVAVTAAMAGMQAMAKEGLDGTYSKDVDTALRNIVQPGWYGTVNNAAGVIRKSILPFWSTDLEESSGAVSNLDAELVKLYTTGKKGEAQAMFDKLVAGASKWGGSVDDVKGALPGYIAAMGEAETATAGVGNAAEDAAAKISPLTRAMTRFGHAIDVRNAVKDWKKSLKDYVKKPSQETADAAAAAFQSVVGTYKKDGKAQSQFVADNYAQMAKIIKDSGLGKSMSDPLKEAKAAADKVLASLAAIDGKSVTATINVDSGFPYMRTGDTPLRKATGGYISGPGSGTSDSIPALLSNGEYVLRAAAVSRLGVGNLNRLNHADKMNDPALLARLASSGEAPVSAGGPLIGSIVVNNPSADIDVEKAVTRGLRRAERIRAELAASHG